SAITHYTVTAADSTTPANGGQTCTWTTGTLTCTVTGLTDGDSYTFTVTAANSVGTSAASTASNAVTPAISAPSAPTGLTTATTYYFTVKAVNGAGSSVASNEAWATPAATTSDAPQDADATLSGNASVAVSWVAPLDSGGSSITGYVVTPYIGPTAQSSSVFQNNTATTETISGLVPGTAYTFTVAAINASGTGAQSEASNLVTVPPANTTITLSLSADTVTYGNEQAENFSVVVSPAYSGPVPNGTVVITNSTTTLCTITLSAAKGSCSLTSEELPAGSFSVYAN